MGRHRAPPVVAHLNELGAQPLVSYRVIVDLIRATKTRTGLRVRCKLDSNLCPKGISISDKEMRNLSITRDRPK